MIEDMKKAKTSQEKQIEHFEKQVNFLLPKRSGELNLLGYMYELYIVLADEPTQLVGDEQNTRVSGFNQGEQIITARS